MKRTMQMGHEMKKAKKAIKARMSSSMMKLYISQRWLRAVCDVGNIPRSSNYKATSFATLRGALARDRASNAAPRLGFSPSRAAPRSGG